MNKQPKNMLPRNHEDDYCDAAVAERHDFLQGATRVKLSAVSASVVDPRLTRGNIENFIGFAQVPMGIVGPVKIDGEHASGDFYVPMATTEGALVASYNRGARVVSLSGGVRVVSVRDTMQRAPFFVFSDIKKAKEFTFWLRDNFNDLIKIAAKTTNHGRLENYTTYIVGRTVYVRLEYSVGDAMGMNMITKATAVLCQYIAARFTVSKWVIESNMAVDKKPAYINMILGRGKSVSAEATIPREIVSKYLGVSARDMADNIRSQIVGNMLAGVTGCTYHFANGIAAIYLACGQDVANVSESAIGVVNFEDNDGDLYVSLYLPSLIVGTIGGGTGLPTQREALALMGCEGAGKARKLAELVAATLLAGEISLAASITAGDFTAAHERYGRNRPEAKPQISATVCSD